MYTCSACRKPFSRKDSLDRHVRFVHSLTHSPKNHQESQNSYSPSPRVPQDSQTYSIHPPSRYQDVPNDNNYFLSALSPSQLNLPPTCEKHALPWKHPFTCLIAGPTGSGKTSFVKRFLAHVDKMITPVPDKITWFYDEYQTMYSEMSDRVDFVQGLPNVDTLSPQFKHLIVIDDLMSEANEHISALFTKKSHHRNISVMYIVQNVFHQTKEHRNISLNAHYMVLFKNPRDYTQITKLGQQMFPHRGTDFIEAYRRATLKPYGYLVVDLKQDTDEEIRLRTFVFPGEYQLIFAP